MNCKGQIIIIIYNYFTKGFPGGSNGKNLPAMQETQVWSLSQKELWRREKSMNRGAWWVTVHGVAKSWTWLTDFHYSTQFSSVTQSYLTLWDPMDCSMPGFPVHHQLPELAQTHAYWVSDATHHLILCHPHHILPSVFPNIRVFSSESVLHISWPKYWSFSLSISP